MYFVIFVYTLWGMIYLILRRGVVGGEVLKQYIFFGTLWGVGIRHYIFSTLWGITKVCRARGVGWEGKEVYTTTFQTFFEFFRVIFFF